MSRFFVDDVEITSFDPINRHKIVAAVAKAMRPQDEHINLLPTDGRDSIHLLDGVALYASDTEYDLAERIARAAWDANGGYCEVIVLSAWDDSPREDGEELEFDQSFCFGEEEYAELVTT
jgi:hypothetical protein